MNSNALSDWHKALLEDINITDLPKTKVSWILPADPESIPKLGQRAGEELQERDGVLKLEERLTE